MTQQHAGLEFSVPMPSAGLLVTIYKDVDKTHLLVTIYKEAECAHVECYCHVLQFGGKTRSSMAMPRGLVVPDRCWVFLPPCISSYQVSHFVTYSHRVLAVCAQQQDQPLLYHGGLPLPLASRGNVFVLYR